MIFDLNRRFVHGKGDPDTSRREIVKVLRRERYQPPSDAPSMQSRCQSIVCCSSIDRHYQLWLLLRCGVSLPPASGVLVEHSETAPNEELSGSSLLLNLEEPYCIDRRRVPQIPSTERLERQPPIGFNRLDAARNQRKPQGRRNRNQKHATRTQNSCHSQCIITTKKDNNPFQPHLSNVNRRPR